MKKLLAAVLLACIALCPLSLAETMIANPWTQTDAEGLMQTLGLGFTLPEGADEIVYRMMESESLAEAQFAWQGAHVTARIKPAAAFEDISGLYYAWDSEENCEIHWCAGKILRKSAGEESVQLCLWYDAAPGLMYSVGASAPKDAEPDIHALAIEMFTPVQGDADANAADVLAEVLSSCTGYEGTAGASLKEAIAAQKLLTFAKNYPADGETFAAAVSALTDEQRGELSATLPKIAELIETAFAGYDSVKGLFDDAGVGEIMSALTQDENAREGWTAFRTIL